jgi:hypothetical protein
MIKCIGEGEKKIALSPRSSTEITFFKDIVPIRKGDDVECKILLKYFY